MKMFNGQIKVWFHLQIYSKLWILHCEQKNYQKRKKEEDKEFEKFTNQMIAKLTLNLENLIVCYYSLCMRHIIVINYIKNNKI